MSKNCGLMVDPLSDINCRGEEGATFSSSPLSSAKVCVWHSVMEEQEVQRRTLASLDVLVPDNSF